MASSWKSLSIKLLSTLLLLVAIFKFVDQDFLSRKIFATDFRPAYLSTRLWLHGIQPYDPAAMIQEVGRSMPSAFKEAQGNSDLQYALYPPSCFPVLALLAMLPWRVAAVGDLLLCAVFYLVFIYVASRRLTGSRRYYFSAFALAFAPFHGGFETGNLSALSGPLACAAILLTDSAPIWSGIALGIAAALKPQLAALFILYLLLTRRWKPFFIASGVAFAGLLSGVAWFAIHGVHWVQGYRNNVLVMISPFADNKNAITFAGRVNFQLFNIQPLVFWVTRNVSNSVTVSECTLGLLLVLVLLLAYARSVTPGGDETNSELGILALLSLLGFIAVYQQFYSAIPLLIVFLWGLRNWQTLTGKVLTIYGLVFIIPMTKLAVLAQLLDTFLTHKQAGHGGLEHDLLKGGLPAGMGTTWIQQSAFALPILFVLLAFVLIYLQLWRYGQWKTGARESEARMTPLRADRAELNAE